LDLEGSELLALLGANATIARDRPVLTTEVMIQGKAGKVEALLVFSTIWRLFAMILL